MSDRALQYITIILIVVVGGLVVGAADGSIDGDDSRWIAAFMAGATVTFVVLGWKGNGPKT